MPVELPDLTLNAVLGQVVALHDATHQGGLTGAVRKQRVLPEILGWLWDTAVGPVLDALAPRWIRNCRGFGGCR